jgi:histidinol dehydrogenase
VSGPRRLDSCDPSFAADLDRLVAAGREQPSDLRREVEAILARVAAEGDAAVIDFSRRFDRVWLEPATFRVSQDELDRALASCEPELRVALELAAARITVFHQEQLPRDLGWEDEQGVRLGLRWRPLDAVGLYVPGGTAAYPSSLLMNALPARIAGVERIVMTVPAPGGVLSPLILAAARVAGVDEVYRIGGAQAIAALAYGTETIAPVDKITGPGNAYVAAAKARVFGRVGIDMIAGPSEVLILADADNDPDWIALDLLAQAEHDASAQSILVTDDAAFAEAVAAAVEARLATLARRAVASASWRDFGALIVVRDWSEALALTDRIAPEHLEIMTADPETLAARVRHAGAIFLGALTPEAIGDYVGGPNHVLPTARSARFSSGLSVLDFMKRTTIARLSPGALAAIGPAAETLAHAEGLEAHALSVAARRARLNADGRP